jgi:hypothetical protein
VRLSPGQYWYVRRFNTFPPFIYSLVVCAGFTATANAQSVLRFPRIFQSTSAQTIITIKNPTNRFADVQYTLHARPDSGVSQHLLVPVRYRIGPHDSLSLSADEVFGVDVSGWIQATSSVSGLQGTTEDKHPYFQPISARLGPNDGSLRTVQGRAFYEKIDVTDNGLDLTHPVIVPIRNARVEVVDPATNAIISATQTDQIGHFEVVAPAQSKATVRVLSRMRDAKVLVEDNTNRNALYSAASDLNPQDPAVFILARDATRISGAFNILEVLQEARELLKYADPSLVAPDVTVLWSRFNSPARGGAKEAVGSTYFDRTTNSISLLGDRSADSDEFDDSVIAHEFGHLAAAAFSHDSSPGGVHILGDALDPRIAWSEGWANFFSSAVRNNPLYRDSYGPNGSSVLRYDLRVDIPQGDQPGSWSEFSVHSLLWDLFDSRADDNDAIAQPIQVIWPAFRDLAQDHFVYLPYFLGHLLNRNPGLTGGVMGLVQSRSIDFSPVPPSVSNPFPTPINVGQLVTGTVDSLTTKRIDLLHSSDFLIFQTSGGPTSIRMDVTGLGPGNNPDANNLDLFLYDLNGGLIALSDRGLNGQSQLIPVVLTAGTYIVEVRSYYGRADTLKTVFNSGSYQLVVRTVPQAD